MKYVKMYKMYAQSNAESNLKCSIQVAQSTPQIRKFQEVMGHGPPFCICIEAALHSQNSLK